MHDRNHGIADQLSGFVVATTASGSETPETASSPVADKPAKKPSSKSKRTETAQTGQVISLDEKRQAKAEPSVAEVQAPAETPITEVKAAEPEAQKRPAPKRAPQKAPQVPARSGPRILRQWRIAGLEVELRKARAPKRDEAGFLYLETNICKLVTVRVYGGNATIPPEGLVTVVGNVEVITTFAKDGSFTHAMLIEVTPKAKAKRRLLVVSRDEILKESLLIPGSSFQLALGDIVAQTVSETAPAPAETVAEPEAPVDAKVAQAA